MRKDYKGVTLLYNARYDSYGNAFVNDGKVANAYFYGTEKAENWGFKPVSELDHDVSTRVFTP